MKSNKNDIKTIKCSHCQKMVPITQFCIYCGFKLDPSALGTLDQPILITCPHCRVEVPKTTYCISCGNKFDLISQKPIPPPSESMKCPLCRQEVPSAHNFCHLCGGRLKKKQGEKEQDIFCTRCWKPNPPNTEFCIHCGLNRQKKESKILEEPFEGFQLDLSHFFQPVSFPLSALRQSLTSSKDFPLKSTISHSKYFGVTKSRKASLFFRNFGGFDSNNLFNYLGTFILLLLIYIFWYTGRYADLVDQVDPITDGIITFIFGGVILTILLMVPIWLSTFMLYRNTGYRMNYRLDSSRVFITVIFNFLWILFPFFGPIILQLGDFKDPQERVIVHRSFVQGIVLGSILTICGTLILGLLNLLTIGIPGVFAGLLFQNHPINSHIITSYFGATWISLILLLPFGDYFDKVLKRWNQFGYLILLAVGLLLLTHSFNIMGLLSQNVYRA
ncbi:MAG: zinc ribbon domain-containing protein [Candidatus Heimdallarchaeota archaeon]|nr:MAG: zinc ribbon domain-containing protein [Candidatus Heimdallarchaeota archaeon]